MKGLLTSIQLRASRSHLPFAMRCSKVELEQLARWLESSNKPLRRSADNLRACSRLTVANPDFQAHDTYSVFAAFMLADCF